MGVIYYINKSWINMPFYRILSKLNKDYNKQFEGAVVVSGNGTASSRKIPKTGNKMSAQFENLGLVEDNLECIMEKLEQHGLLICNGVDYLDEIMAGFSERGREYTFEELQFPQNDKK